MGLIKEFKEFALKGNVMDMAIGVLIGGAFSGIITAFTNDFINPIIASLGGTEIAGVIRLPWVDYSSLATLEEKTMLSLNYGDFITQVINFLIIAFVLFLLLKGMNKLLSLQEKLNKKEEEPIKEPEVTEEVKLLTEIRDLMKK